MFKAHDQLLELQEVGEKLAAHVHDICVFGSTNVGDSRKAEREYLKYIQLIHTILLASDQMMPFLTELRRKIPVWNQFASASVLVANMRRIRVKTAVGGPGVAGIFEKRQEIFYLPLASATSVEVMQLVNAIYPFNTHLNFNALKTSDFYSVLANLLEGDSVGAYGASHSNVPGFIKGDRDRRAYKQQLAENSFTSKNDKELFIRSTIHFVKNSAYFCGVGNCELMTDVACLEAIFLPHNYPIRYVRFLRDDRVVDELNCIVLGDWPKPGCLVVSPWLSAEKRVFTWQGSIETTQQLSSINQNYNCSRVIIHITPTEKEKFKKQLSGHGYQNWKLIEIRDRNLQFIKECAERCVEFVKARQEIHAEAAQSILNSDLETQHATFPTAPQ